MKSRTTRLMALVLAFVVALVLTTPHRTAAQPAVGVHTYSPLTGWTPDRYPDAESFVMSTAQKISWNKFQIASTGPQPLANAGSLTGIFYAWPYSWRTLHLTIRRDASASPSTALIYFWSAEDSAGPYRPVMIVKAGATAGNQYDFGDTSTQDTLKITVPFKNWAANNGFAYAIPNTIYLGKYVKLMATKFDTTSGQADSVTVGATWWVRR